MNKSLYGFTIIEMFIGITLLAVIVGSILGVFILIQEYYKNGVAMIDSQAEARILAERIVRPIRHASEFEVLSSGDELRITMEGAAAQEFGSEIIFKYEDNTIKKNGNQIAGNIFKIPNEDLFLDLFLDIESNEIVGINFLVKNTGVTGVYKEVRISTETNLRN